MSIFKNFVKKNKRGTVFIILILISFGLLTYSSKSVTITFRQVVFSIIYPFQYTFFSIGDFFQNTFSSISQLKKIQEELDRTKKELDQYKKVIIDFNELINENNSLKKILDLKQNIIYNSEVAEVIARDPQRMTDILIINKGSSNGIKENMPVISYMSGKKVLIGKIAEVTAYSSKVITLNNTNFSAGVVIVRNRVHCIIQGDNEKPGIVKLLYIPKQYILSDQGMDFVFTSGDSLIFPQGLEIGKIIKIIPSPKYEVFNEAYVQISVELSKLEQVLVLKVNYEKDNFKIMELPN